MNYKVQKGILSSKEIKVLRDLKKKLQSVLGNRLSRIILFGSKARGDADAESDIDVAILVSKLDRDLKRIILDSVAEIELRYLKVISSFVLSLDEFNRLRKRERRIAMDIEKDGIKI